MKKRITIFAIMLFTVLITTFSVPTKTDALCYYGKYSKYDAAAGKWECSTPTVQGNSGVDKIDDKIQRTVEVAAGLALALGGLLIIYSGYMIVTSAGDPKKLQRAKLILISACVGVFIALTVFVWNHAILSEPMDIAPEHAGPGGPQEG